MGVGASGPQKYKVQHTVQIQIKGLSPAATY